MVNMLGEMSIHLLGQDKVIFYDAVLTYPWKIFVEPW